MNVMNRVTLKSMRKNRTRTIVTIVGIILSSAMFTAVLTLCTTIYNHLHAEKIYQSGSYHVCSMHVPASAVKAAEADERLEYIAVCRVEGYAQIPSADARRPYICLIAADSTFFENMPVHLTKGRLPEKNGEIVVPEQLMLPGGGAYGIGDTIEAELGMRVIAGSEEDILYQENGYLKDGEEFVPERKTSLTVVGVCSRPDFEPYGAAGYSALTLREGGIEEDCVYECYFRVKDPNRNLDRFLSDHPAFRANGFEENSMLLTLEGASIYDNVNQVLYGMAAILSLLIFAGSVSLIHNAFSISVSERTRQFGLLASVGATKRQIRRSVIFEALSVSAIGIPIGVLAGVGGIAVVVLLLGDKLSSMLSSYGLPFRTHVTWLGVAGGALLTLVTVLISAWIPSARAQRITPMEAIRQSRDIKAKDKNVRISPLALKLFGAEGMLAKKYYKRSKRKYRSTIASLSMSVILFIAASGFIMFASRSADTVTEPGINYDCYYGVMDMEAFARLRGELARYADELAGFISDDSGDRPYYYAPESAYTDEYKASRAAQIKDSGNIRNYYDRIVELHYMDDVSFRELLAKNGLSEEGYFDPDHPKAIVLNRGCYTSYADGDRVTYSYDYFKPGTSSIMISRETEAPDGYRANGPRWSGKEWGDGELIVEFTYVGDGSTQIVTGAHSIPPVKLEFDEISIGAMIYEPPVGGFIFGDLSLYFPASVYKGNASTAGFYFKSGDVPTSIRKMTEAMEGAGVTVISDGFLDLTAGARNDDNAIMVVNVFSYGFITLISLICVANVFNTISTNIALRRRDYAMLRSMGMTEKGLRRMSNYECIIYGAKALMIGLPIAAAITYLIYKVVESAVVMPFTLPWGAAAIAVISVFAVVFASMLYSTNKLKKGSPIDALKDESA